ncbi:MAG: EAL domain-containing protein [Zoogloeaceae bacterium]|nr:EAL domain-containing protein [Zoogloeaceae bacterium]
MNVQSTDQPRLLIVDDSPASLRTLADALSDLGAIHLASSGAQALQIARRVQPDLVLVDVEMPGMSGFEFFHALRNDPWTANCAVIFVTGGTDAGYEITSLSEGAVDFLTKPVDGTTARLRVRNHLLMKRRGDQLAAARMEMAQLVNNLPSLVLSLDTQGHVQFSNDRCLEWFGEAEETLAGKPLSALLGDEAADAVLARVPAVLSGERVEISLAIRTPNAGDRVVQALLVVSGGSIPGQSLILLLNDVSRLRQAELALAEEKERLRVTLQSIGDAVIATDTQGVVTFINPIAERMTGWQSEEAIGRPINQVMRLEDAQTRAVLNNPVFLALKERRIVGMAFDCRLMALGGETYEVEDSAAPINGSDGELIGAIIVFHDVSEARALALKMTHLANHDALTDLPNRLLLQDRLTVALRNANHSGRRVALVIIDVDNFKFINSAAGHQAGDRVIQLLASRLQRALPRDATLARFGGDEFVVLLPDIESAESVADMVAALRQAAHEHFQFDSNRFDVTLSAGASVYPDDCQDPEMMLRHADVALHRAKSDGKDRLCFFSTELELRLVGRHQVELNIREALAEDRIEAHFQSQVCHETGRVVGAEALVRIRRADGTLVSPAEFIPVAEETGLIVPLGREVVRQACVAAAAWARAGTPIKVSVNISSRQFADDDLVAVVSRNLAEAGIPSSLIVLEITESTLMIDTSQTIETLHALRALGVGISIDDFGIGYSSLRYLRLFPASSLKIDQSFVREFLVDRGDEAIVRTVIALGESLGLELVAEGVERPEQAERLSALGCKVMQGYLYSRPVPASAFSFDAKPAS